MHGLEVPAPLAGFRVESEDRLGEQALSRAVAAVPVVARGAGCRVGDAQFLVAADPGPDVGGAGIGRFGAVPGIESELARLGDDVEAPAQGSGARIVAPDHPRRVLPPRPGVGRRFTDHDRVAAHDGRRCPEVLAARHAAADVEHVGAPAVAEVRVEGAGVRVEGGQPAVAGEEEPPPLSLTPGHAAADGAAAHVPWLLVLERIVGPQNLAAGGVERGRGQAGRDQHPSVAHHRRVLEHEGRNDALVAGGDPVVDRLPAPGDLELMHVVAVDLVERRVLAAPAVSGVVVPLAGGLCFCGAG